MSDIVSQASRFIVNTVPDVIRNLPTVFGKELPAVEMAQPAMVSAAKVFVRVAGVSGFLAVSLGAYGAHGGCLEVNKCLILYVTDQNDWSTC